MDKHQNNNITDSIKDELINPTFDLIEDYSQLALEHLVDNPAIKEIPFVKSIIGVTRGALAIKEIFLVTKIIEFIKQFHHGNIPESERQEFLSQIEDRSQV